VASTREPARAAAAAEESARLPAEEYQVCRAKTAAVPSLGDAASTSAATPSAEVTEEVSTSAPAEVTKNRAATATPTAAALAAAPAPAGRPDVADAAVRMSERRVDARKTRRPRGGGAGGGGGVLVPPAPARATSACTQSQRSGWRAYQRAGRRREAGRARLRRHPGQAQQRLALAAGGPQRL